jgi:hypothetical protein
MGHARPSASLERHGWAAVVALACQLPATTGVPLSRWSAPELAAELRAQGLAGPISRSSVLRILAEHPIKPWRYQSWIFPRDPDFAAKATVILGLYQGYYQSKRLRPGDRIVCVDAKPSIQARARRHATSPPGRGRPARVEHEYDRTGALALLAALDVRTGKVFASCPPATGIAPFMALIGQVMSQEPYASAARLFVIVDNGSDHRGQTAARRLREAHPNAIMIHTPVHASWLNQAEIVFSIVQKRSSRPTTSPPRPSYLAGLHRPVQPPRPAVQLEVHRNRPGPAPPPDQRSPRTRQPATGRLSTPDELTGSPT